MYLLFRYHGIFPSAYADAGYGEKLILRAFMHYEAEERNREREEIAEMFDA